MDYIVCLSNIFIILEEMFGLEILKGVSEMMHCLSDSIFIWSYSIIELYLCFL